MFRGSSTHTLDDKGRFIVPSRFRDLIRAGGGDSVMITRRDGCLYAFTLNEWAKLEGELSTKAQESDIVRRFRRVFVGNAHECPCDKQGRVLIPPTLRVFADLEKEIVLVGVLDHFEIWSQERWDNENGAVDLEMKQVEVRNEIAKLGL